jgi:hypothetical protein
MKKYFVLIAALALLGWSCKPDDDAQRLLDQFVVSTSYDNTAQFGGYTTYSMSTDTIGFVSNNSNDTIITQKNDDYPRPVLQKVEQNLSAKGYTRVARNQNPDLYINVYVVNDFNIYQTVTYNNYYYPSYYGYGYGYGGYSGYPSVSTYSSNTGSLVIEILDLRNVTPDNKVKVLWSAYMGDVYSSINLIQQSQDAIDQAFVQSPYIGKQ